MRKNLSGRIGPALALSMIAAGFTAPAQAQDADGRLRRLEAEVRAIKRDMAPGGDRTVAPQAMPISNTMVPGAPASTPLSDLLTRMDTLEGQLTRLTSQNEEAGNRIRQLETRLATAEATLRPAPIDPTGEAGATSGPAAASFAPGDSAASSNMAAMTGNAPLVRQASVATVTPARPTPAGPSAQRLAAVRAVVKPQSSDPADDEYSYGFRLWEAKLYPEAEQQLKLFLDKYPRHPRVSYARNLMGRALLDENKPREAAPWFLQNYQADKRGARAPDSLLLLAESMRKLGDKSRACIALSEFAETYPAEAAGRLRRDYDATRSALTCN
jgi:TolA-binding protein